VLTCPVVRRDLRHKEVMSVQRQMQVTVIQLALFDGPTCTVVTAMGCQLAVCAQAPSLVLKPACLLRPYEIDCLLRL